jgi:hypothetical protein
MFSLRTSDCITSRAISAEIAVAFEVRLKPAQVQDVCASV